MTTETLLKDIHKTNPSMTKDRLIEELFKSRYSSAVLVALSQNKVKER